jgi:hypothetical protein
VGPLLSGVIIVFDSGLQSSTQNFALATKPKIPDSPHIHQVYSKFSPPIK